MPFCSRGLGIALLGGLLCTFAIADPAPARAARLVFASCTSEQTQTMQRAYAKASSDADKGVTAAAAPGTTTNDPAFIEWFGVPNTTSVAHVRATLASTQTFMRSRQSINVLCATGDDACSADIAPEVGTRFGDALTLCKSFFRLPLEGETAQSVALLRELTFLAGHTNDGAFTTTSAKALAKVNPPTALGEAANYAYYSALGYTP